MSKNVADPELVATVWYETICDAVKSAAAKTLPPRKRKTLVERKVSERTKLLYREKKIMQSRAEVTRDEFNRLKSRINASCMQDFKDWVTETVVAMEKADAVGDTRTIFNLTNRLSNKPKKPQINLTSDSSGNLLRSPEDVAKTWEKFLSEKFSATQAEHERSEMPPIPKTVDPITRQEFDQAIHRLKDGKAIGPDGVPAAVYKNCPLIKEELFKLLQFMWDEEVVPQSLATAKFKMLYKHKGSRNDPTRYRCLAMLNHAYKILSYIVLGRLLDPSKEFLKDWQAGFRESRGCRDNSMVLRVLCEKVMSIGESLAAVFIDYKAAFDSLSHKFIDETLEKAGISPKVRAIFRAIYKAASAYTTAPGADGKHVKSDIFSIERGALQGNDVISPIFFIMTLELILRRYDHATPIKGITIGDLRVHLLGYADDVSVLDSGTKEGIQRLTTRVSLISQGSREDADMDLSAEKSFCLHVKQQDDISPMTSEEVRAQCKFTCPHLNCGHKFMTKAGLKIHMGRCEWRDEFEVERLVDHRGPVVARKYKVRWKGYSQDYDTWEPRTNLHPDLIKEYEITNQVYVYNWKHRCGICDLPCSSSTGVKIHQARSHKLPKPQNFKGCDP